MILYFNINVKDLFRLGKAYPWVKPDRCPKCKGIRLWGHGFVQRCFRGYSKKIWLKRYRCPDCNRVHTIRPANYWSRFHYCRFIILRCLLKKIRYKKWASSISYQAQQYWFKGLIFQSSIYKNTGFPTEGTLRVLFSKPIIPASHSIKSEVLRC